MVWDVYSDLLNSFFCFLLLNCVLVQDIFLLFSTSLSLSFYFSLTLGFLERLLKQPKKSWGTAFFVSQTHSKPFNDSVSFHFHRNAKLVCLEYREPRQGGKLDLLSPRSWGFVALFMGIMLDLPQAEWLSIYFLKENQQYCTSVRDLIKDAPLIG